MAKELAPTFDISPASECGELIRIWQCSDHVCVMIDSLLFDDQIQGYGQLLAETAIKFLDAMPSDDEELREKAYHEILELLQREQEFEQIGKCPAKKLEKSTIRERLPLPPCASRDDANYELARCWLFSPFGEPEMKASIIPLATAQEIATLIINTAAAISVAITRAGKWSPGPLQTVTRFFSKDKKSLDTLFFERVIERTIKILNADRKQSELAQKLDQQRRLDDMLLQRMSQMGCPLSDEHEIDHFFYCDDSKIPLLAEKLQAIGLTVKPEDSHPGALSCIETASPKSMPDKTLQLVRIAHQFGAVYDGWGSICPNMKRADG